MSDGFDAKKLSKKLDAIAEILPGERPDLSDVKPNSAKLLRERIANVVTSLIQLRRWLDPIEHPEEIFDPASPHSAAELITQRMLKMARQPLGSLKPFWGSGIYALYYEGGHRAYRAISASEIPIYVGKAEPGNERASTPEEQGTKLHGRLSDHAKSIRAAEADPEHSLRLADFECRYLVLNSAYAAASEANLLRSFAPVWNFKCAGFGKHGDSGKTRNNTRSEWDTLHPGRKWAKGPENKSNPKTPATIQAEIIEYCKRYR